MSKTSNANSPTKLPEDTFFNNGNKDSTLKGTEFSTKIVAESDNG